VRSAAISPAEALAVARTGDLWLFRGRKAADRAIQVATNAPVNHVAMAVALDDLPPLLWHAEAGRTLTDVWTGEHQRGVQLNRLDEALAVWTTKYRQRPFVRQLDADVTPAMEDDLLRVVAELDGRPFPSTRSLVSRWLRGRWRRRVGGDLVYCAELLAITYTRLGLLDERRPPNWYDPGRFWSGDRLPLRPGVTLGDEVAVAEGGDEVAVTRTADAERRVGPFSEDR
jgi:hypothetical protein